MLATYGIQTQTPHQIEPIQIWPPSELVKAYEQLGVNDKLGLKGRPGRPIGGLGTAKVGNDSTISPFLMEKKSF
jgi:phosphorylase kinase alpha/beta subunit